ncbi:transcriptional regulator [Collibacillus ludicampi]|uniref:Transcriptional regulator n=1 Tax=Collibacillus ludicampi TaxID=2771369 RepID=A0AAV4LBH8_9BACL|nr:Rrf2 family transcriptional regulator [Collibacillus ludicampi]GIM45033.1 transcriptional regulator [Collibacillus ludicampi]
MKLSARGHYGLIAMTYLAQLGNEEPVSIKTIAVAEQIPESFLEQIFHTLRKSGLVTSVRGARGGFRLARPSNQLTAGEVVRALEGPITPVECLDLNAAGDCCCKIGSCSTKIVWERLRDIMVAFLDSITLEDIVERSDKLYGRLEIPAAVQADGHAVLSEQ